jgi:NitT/TauT family transport system substrate-binding protein
MKSKSLLGMLLLVVLITASCSGGAATATQEPVVASTATEQAVSASPTPEPATEVPPTLEPITIKMNSSALTSFAPIFIAESEGYFKNEGITVEYVKFNRVQEALPLVITGDLDIYAGSINAGLLNTLGQENSIKVVADRGHLAPSDTCAYQGMIVRKDLYESGKIKTPADLKGRTIASTTTGPSGYMLSLYLGQAGLTFNDVNIVDLPTAGYIDALANSSVDAIIAPELWLSKMVNAGNGVLAVSAADVVGDYQSSVLVFGKNLLTENREAGIRFLKAYMRGVQQYNEGKTDRNVAIMAKFTEESEDTLRSACWVTINNDGHIDFEKSVAEFQKWSIAQGDLDTPTTERQFWDPSLLNEALAQIKQ